MPYITSDQAKRITKLLKKTLSEECGEDIRLNQCRKAVAEALDLDGEHAMTVSLPCETEWNGEWCMNHLADNYLQNRAAAEFAVGVVEARLSRVLFGMVNDEGVGAPLQA